MTRISLIYLVGHLVDEEWSYTIDVRNENRQKLFVLLRFRLIK